jgi:tRNA-specific 2-thiouridylase
MLDNMKKIVVGLSGGVDSAVTVHLLKKRGYEVVGVFLDMLDDINDSELKRAEILAEQLEIELVRKDIRKLFQKEIINEFVNSYKNGLTPNPCVICNPKIKFKYLLEVADKLDIKKVATGHYARISENLTGEKILSKAKDKTKDQSYFLYRLTQEELQRVIFPLGGLLKTRVKEAAERIGLKVPKAESQDVCFLKDSKDLEEFLQKELASKDCSLEHNEVEREARPLASGTNKEDFTKGDIIDEKGNILGGHRGLLIYTIGQRKGLDIGGDGPFYVVGKDFESNELLVSRNRQDKKLSKKEIVIDDFNWINERPVEDVVYQVKIRYQMKSVEARLEVRSNGQWKVKCNKSVWAVAPGQSLVVYDKDVVVGGGKIVETCLPARDGQKSIKSKVEN